MHEDDVQMGILASLDGRLYKYNSKINTDSSSSSFKEKSKNFKFQIESLEEFPFDLENVLSNSFRINNDIGFIGSVNILTLGINYQTGKVYFYLLQKTWWYLSNKSIKIKSWFIIAHQTVVFILIVIS